jgi:hypothetical protein
MSTKHVKRLVKNDAESEAMQKVLFDYRMLIIFWKVVLHSVSDGK